MSTEKRVTHYVKHIDSIIEAFNNAKSEGSDSIDDSIVYGLIVRIQDTVEKITGTKSHYFIQTKNSVESGWHPAYILDILIGIIKSLRSAIEDGFLTESETLIRGEIFDDFLSMAEYLLQEGYKDPAAVMAGSTLEAHLRHLCKVNGIKLIQNNGKPKSAASMNDDLYKNSIYSATDQKNITAWLSIRNNAAHGHYSEYTAREVALYISGIQNFIQRYPG